MNELLGTIVSKGTLWRAVLVLGVPAFYGVFGFLAADVWFGLPAILSYAAGGVMAVWVFIRGRAAVQHYRPELQQVIAFAVHIFATIFITWLISMIGYIVCVSALGLPSLVGYLAAGTICYAVFERVVFAVGQYEGSRDLATYALQVGMVVLGAMVGAAGGALLGAAAGFSTWAHLIAVVVCTSVGFAASANIFYYAKTALTKHPLAERSPLDKGDWV